jgi:hypothetical protein
MKSSFAQPNTFLAIILPTANSGTQLNSNSSCVTSSLYSLRATPTENTVFFIAACWFTAAEMCLPHRCLAMSASRTTENAALLFLRPCASAGMCLPSRCLAMNYSGFQTSYQYVVHTTERVSSSGNTFDLFLGNVQFQARRHAEYRGWVIS